MNCNSLTAEVFSCENLARSRVMLDLWSDRHSRKRGSDRGCCRQSHEAFGADHACLSVDTNDRPVYKFGDAKRKQALSMVNVEVQPGGHVAH